VILSAHQPAYLPWPGYFDKINKADAFVILDDVPLSQNDKENYVNRVQVRVGDRAQWLTIPLHAHGHLTSTIRQIEIDNSRDWRRKHKETIRHNYSRAPYWKEMSERIGDAITFISYAISEVWEGINVLPIDTEVYLQSDLHVGGEKQELIVNLCKHFYADAFLFGCNGRNYVDEEYFKSQGIMPLYQEYQYPLYKQWGGIFVPGLSIIDMLFNLGLEGTREMICGK
jgi:hypothetical protein